MLVRDRDLPIGEPPLQQRVLHVDADASRRPAEQVGKRVQREVEPRQTRPFARAGRADPGAHRRQVLVDLPFGLVTGGAQAADHDPAELLPMDLEQRPQRRRGVTGPLCRSDHAP
ncbi:MAG TPA: hypothetical protein VN716_26100 [Vicinamibacterales bacterium]|nr:hypothetical protein [Vicinamibacterales bacterium]